MPIYIETEIANEKAWTVATDGAAPIYASDDWSTKSVDMSAVDVVTAALSFGRQPVFIHYSQSNVAEARVYYETFQLAQFLSIKLVQQPMPELAPKKSRLQRLLNH